MTGPLPSFDDGAVAPGDTGYAIEEAYEVNGAIFLDCPTCAARGATDESPAQWCDRDGQTLKIPHTSRLGLAYRTNHPMGARRHKAREEHLKEHRKTYRAPWKERPNR